MIFLEKIPLKSESPTKENKNTFPNGNIFVVFLAIFISFFSTVNSVVASEVTGDLSNGLIGTRTLTTITSAVMQEEVTNRLISIGSSSPTSTPNFTFNVDYILNTGGATVSIPADTVVTKTGGGNLDLTTFFTSDNTIEIKSELGDVLGSIKFGIPDISLTFSKPITVTIPVGTDYNGQTLTTYYRNEGSTVWNTETTCLITDGNCTFQTSHATTFATKKNSTSSSSSSSPTSSSNNSAPSCGDAKPSSIPDLFQINVNSTTAKLFFTPINNTSQFYISFSTKPNAEENGEQISLLREGVQSEIINLLKPNTTYYFKVRGQIGCMPGDWSNIMKITTRSKGIIKTTLFYKYKKTNIITKIVSKAVSIFTPKKVLETPTPELIPTIIPTIITQTKVTKTPTQEPIPTIITQTKSNTTITPPVIIKKRCFLWWCF